MTVIVGILCQDGAVIGADSSSTFGNITNPTIEQKSKKIDILSDNVIVAGTGQVGLNQRFKSIVEENFKANVFVKYQSEIKVATQLCALTLQDFQRTLVQRNQYGALLAFPFKGKIHLCEFATSDFQPEFKTDSVWYCSLGCGQPIADPFLGFIRRIFWGDTKPTLQDGILATLWTLQEAIELNPGGINGPAQVAVLCKEASGNFKARMLEQNEMDEHKNNVKELEEHIRKYRTIITSSPAEIPSFKT